jgi:hypothetical protein
MQRALIASGVLGLGTALVFGAAAVTATLFPSGATVAPNMNVMWARDDMMMAKPMPAAPMPVMITNEGGGIQPAPEMAPTPMPEVAEP